MPNSFQEQCDGTRQAFGIDPEEFERALREVGIEFRDLLGKAGEYIDRTSVSTLVSLLGQFVQPERMRPPKPEGETTGETGSGVWVIYSIDDASEARVEQVFPSELETLRAQATIPTNALARGSCPTVPELLNEFGGRTEGPRSAVRRRESVGIELFGEFGQLRSLVIRVPLGESTHPGDPHCLPTSEPIDPHHSSRHVPILN
ncbi:hypothetical protein [Nocardia sp. NPDC004604]|uniref:hypothetical protein n=1 Tax=Nocardia sp. NPDC004604 TaxID=3157013 RepID=UPI0033B482B0